MPQVDDVFIYFVSLHPMKRKLYLLTILFVLCASVSAQSRIILPDSSDMAPTSDSLDMKKSSHNHLDHLFHDHGAEADSLKKLSQMKNWILDVRTGNRIEHLPDTLLHNFQQTTIPDGESVAMGFVGPLGAPAYSKLFFDRGETETFVFNNAYSYYMRSPETHLFTNTRVPFATLHYQSGGGDRRKEERFKGMLTSNFGKALNVGIEADLVNAKGFYNSQAVKHNNFMLFGNYISDRLEVHAYGATSTLTNFENGGITDELFIRYPDSIRQSFSSNDIPVKFINTWNRVKKNQVFASGRYNLGYTTKADSVKKIPAQFIPVASLTVSSQFTQQYRRFLSHDTAYVDGNNMQKIDQFYADKFYNSAVDDSTHYTSFRNSAALSLREGFKPWVKFGLTAFIEHEIRNYQQRGEVADSLGMISYRENALTIGGVLNKQQGEYLQFNLGADIGILGANLGETRLYGNVQTGFDLFGKRTTLSGEAYLKNLKPKYLQEHVHTKYFWWDKELGDTRRVYVGGKLFIPFTNTELGVGVENIQNHIYYGADKQIAQEGSSIQVLAARINQKIKLGIFNWDNEVVYQTSSNTDVIPLPTLSVYSNMYLKAKIVNELTLQLGVDAHYHTRYFAPGYEPALLQFYNQKEREIGNYPITTAYANMHLKTARFYLMFYNVGSTFLKPRDYFTMPGYPVNPFVFKAGVSVNLHN